MQLLLKYYSLRGIRIFIIISIINMVIVWLSHNLLITETVFYNTYSEQLTMDRSLMFFESMKEFVWLSYALVPVMLFLKSTIISLIIYTGIFLYNLNSHVTFGSVFRIVLSSEIILSIASIIKVLWLYFFGGNFDLNDMGFFYPLSLINFFSINEISLIWIYPLQIINVFQVLYILLLSFGLKKVCRLEDSDSDKVVLSTYIPAITIWIALIIFLSIDLAV